MDIYKFIPEIPESFIHVGKVEMFAGVSIPSTVTKPNVKPEAEWSEERQDLFQTISGAEGIKMT